MLFTLIQGNEVKIRNSPEIEAGLVRLYSRQYRWGLMRREVGHDKRGRGRGAADQDTVRYALQAT